jgi:general secretion pathway protein D
VGVTQGFGQGFFGGGGQNRPGQTTNQTGRNANGQVVNTRDLSNQVTAIADPNTNSIIVVTSPENAAIIRSILDQLDRIPEQVLIETIIVEATLTSSDKLGVEWNYSGGGRNQSTAVNDFLNTGANATATQQEGFRYTLTGTNYSVFLNALKADTKFQVLSTPKIFTSNNVQAEINISQSLPYITSSIQNVNGTFTNNYQFTDVGIVLTVTPRITSNGMVAMEVEQTANDLQGYTEFNAPIINQRIANTQVSVKDGETIILGGIIRNSVNSDVRKVPVLGDIPLLGNLFRSTVKSKQKTELLVFLTPRIVRDPDEAHRLREDIQRKMSPETDKAFKEYQRTGNNEKKATPVGTGTTTPPVRQPGGN